IVYCNQDTRLPALNPRRRQPDAAFGFAEIEYCLRTGEVQHGTVAAIFGVGVGRIDAPAYARHITGTRLIDGFQLLPKPRDGFSDGWMPVQCTLHRTLE